MEAGGKKKIWSDCGVWCVRVTVEAMFCSVCESENEMSETCAGVLTFCFSLISLPN